VHRLCLAAFSGGLPPAEILSKDHRDPFTWENARMPLRVVLMGTGTFALPTFRALIASHHSVVAIVTQPDRTGRGHHRHVNPVRELGVEHHIPVMQPPRAAAADFLDALKTLKPDVIVVAAYGQILKSELLEIPRLGAFNLHGSLLPRHRGAAPVQYAIWHGDQRTGVTMFQIEPALDSGPIVGVVETDIEVNETAECLMARLADLCAPLTLSVVDQLDRGAATFSSQVDSEATLSPRLGKASGKIDWSRTAREIDCHVRAMQPWPRAVSNLVRPGKANLRCIFHEVTVDASHSPVESASNSVGAVRVDNRQLFVKCSGGWLQVDKIQPEGSRALEAGDFINGQGKLEPGCFC
jgi:methionyl-tRNA formyltransferase